MKTFEHGVHAMVKNCGEQATIEFLYAQLNRAYALLPKTKQKAFVADFASAVGNKVEVTVVNCLTNQLVKIRWDEVGGPCDPSTERYHCM